MTIGSEGYLSDIYHIALASNGSISFEFIENKTLNEVKAIDEAVAEYLREVHGK